VAIFESYNQFKAGIAAILDKRDDFGSRFETGRDSIVRVQGTVRKSIQMNPPNLLKDTSSGYHGPTNDNDKADDNFPTIEELFRTTLPTDALTAQPSKSERAPL
jgi:hypothetical protein